MIILGLRIKRLSNVDKRICWNFKTFTISVINIWSFGTTFWYFQNGNACYCGNTYKQTIRVKDSQCNRRCPGNKKQTCGGHGTISVYKGKKDWGFLLGWWCLTSLSAIFQLYRSSQFFRWRKPEYPRKQSDCRKLTHQFLISKTMVFFICHRS